VSPATPTYKYSTVDLEPTVLDRDVAVDFTHSWSNIRHEEIEHQPLSFAPMVGVITIFIAYCCC
jgi:hypothetical protein